MKLPPGPPPRDGLLESLWYFYRFFTDAVGAVGERFARYGDIYYAPAGGVGLYVLRHPEHIHQVLVKDGGKYGKAHTAFARLERVVGKGLLTTDGATWRRQRRMVQPAFSAKRLSGYARAMVGEAERHVQDWRGGEVRDISREMMELTLAIVARTLFSHDVRRQTDTVARAIRTLLTLGPVPEVLPRWAPSPIRALIDRALADLDRVILGLIDERRASGRAPDPPDLLQMLVSAVDDEGDGRGLERREIRDQLVTLFIAGHETTSHALTWTWYLLSQHPDQEAALHRELAEVLGDRSPRYDDLEHLPFTGQVLDEAMRLYPPAPTIVRAAVEDAEIGGYPIPRGSEVVVWTYFTHRDPRWFADPERFEPRRFTPEAVAERPKLSYLPFGAGARACIGKVFALVEAKLVLATLAQRYRMRLVPGHRVALQQRITLSPRHGMKMTLDRR